METTGRKVLALPQNLVGTQQVGVLTSSSPSLRFITQQKKHNKICFTYFTNKGNHVDTVRERKGGRN